MHGKIAPRGRRHTVFAEMRMWKFTPAAAHITANIMDSIGYWSLDRDNIERLQEKKSRGFFSEGRMETLVSFLRLFFPDINFAAAFLDKLFKRQELICMFLGGGNFCLWIWSICLVYKLPFNAQPNEDSYSQKFFWELA